MTGGIRADARIRSAEIEATIIRADGRVERLGVISYYHRNPLRRWAFLSRRWLKEKLKWLHW